MVSIARYGRLRPEFMVETVNAQRRLLAEAPFLIDKMVFAATTSMSLTALELALQTTPPDDDGFDSMVHALRPLSEAEVSLRRAMAGELRYMASHDPEEGWSGLFFKRRHALNLQRRVLESIVEESELPGTAFWNGEPRSPMQPTWWDFAFDPVGATFVSISAPAYADYAENLQILDVNATVLRRWAETLSGEPHPLAGSTPESLPHWVWQHNGEFLCLEPTADAPRTSSVNPVCRPSGLVSPDGAR